MSAGLPLSAAFSAAIARSRSIIAGSRSVARQRQREWRRRCASRAACRAPRARPCRRVALERDQHADLAEAGRGRVVHVGHDDALARPTALRRGAADWFSPIVAMLLVSLSADGAAAGIAGLRQRLDIAVRWPARRSATVRTKSWNWSFLATKSVSRVDLDGSAAWCRRRPRRPGLRPRCGSTFLAAAARPLVRSQSIGGFDVAAGLVERLLAVHHAGAGALAQFLHGSGGNFRHVCLQIS